jgi:pimeloyl-ACP methyl ester carboxylesterase/alkylhydroperoxidase family enzyme
MNAPVTHATIAVNDTRTGSMLNVFYREAGPKDAPAVLLLHGFPTSSHQYRGLIDRLSTKYRVVAPDLPGFGFSDAPDAASFGYTFDHLAEVALSFSEALGLEKFALYLFDYGAPVGFRLAAAHPERVTALISQNGNAYEEGLSEAWAPIKAYWADPSTENRNALRGFLQAGTTQFQYEHGEAHTRLIAPETFTLDQHFLDRPGNDEIQLDLLSDYESNVAAYPTFQAYLRNHQPPTLAVWGKNDPFFLPAGAEAFRRDVLAAEVHFVDGGHFPLESHLDEVAFVVRDFLARTIDREQGEALFGPLNIDTTPAAARQHLATAEQAFGFVPVLTYALGAEPAALGAYMNWLQALGQTSLDPIAQQVAMTAASHANASVYGASVHATLAGKLGASPEIVASMRAGGVLSDPKLEAVRQFAGAIVTKRTQVSDSDVAVLKAAGYGREAVVAIAMAVAGKVLVNTVAHLSKVEVDGPFMG